MPLAATSIRGEALNWRFAVKGIQNASVLGEFPGMLAGMAFPSAVSIYISWLKYHSQFSKYSQGAKTLRVAGWAVVRSATGRTGLGVSVDIGARLRSVGIRGTPFSRHLKG
jgi:hypothetical protein